MVAVVVVLEAAQSVFAADAEAYGEQVDVEGHLADQLLLADAANGRELGVHADVLQVVELAENTELRELGDAGEEHEPQPCVACFEWRIELAHHLAECLELVGVVHHVEQRCVVFVDEHDDLLAGLVVSALDKAEQPGARSLRIRVAAKLILASGEQKIEQRPQLSDVPGLDRREVESDDRVAFPRGLEFLDCQSPEQFAAALEIRLHG